MAGQIVRRGKATWLVRVFTGRDGSGKRKWINRTVHGGRREAEKTLYGLLSAVSEQRLAVPTGETLGRFLMRWLADDATNVVRPTTLDGYRMILEKHLVPALGHIRLDRVTPVAIQSYLAQKLAGSKNRQGDWENRPLSASTVVKHTRVLHRALRSAVQWGLLAANPCDRVDTPRCRPFEPRVWDEEQVRLFLGEAKHSSPHYRLYLGATLTGMRQGELLGLRWQDVNLTLGIASIRQTFYRRGHRQLFGEPKSQKSRRTISLPAVLVEELRSLRREQDEHRRLVGGEYDEHDLIFCQPDGKPLHAHNLVQRDFRRVIENAKVPRIRFHDLRHGHATWLLAQGENLKVVSERLGHHTAAFTLSVYAHVLPGMQEQAAARLSARLLGPPDTAIVSSANKGEPHSDENT